MMLLEPLQMPETPLQVVTEAYYVKPTVDSSFMVIPADVAAVIDGYFYIKQDNLESIDPDKLLKIDANVVTQIDGADYVKADIALKERYGKYEIGPMEPGFATTLGNTLRRVLLSSIQGTAVRYVKVEGLHHEFTAVPGGNIDYLDLILRLKNLVFKMETLEEVKLDLEITGPCIVRAGDITDKENCRILNPELVLFELTEDVNFNMELWIGSGRGYVSSDTHDMEDKPVGVIPVDSIYSPIKRVNFQAGHQRVGERIDFDKLILEIWTDCFIEPSNALFLSAKILKDFYEKISLFDVEPEYVEDIEMDPELDQKEKLLNLNVKDLELTVRSCNCLGAAKIETIGELVSKTEHEMLKYRNFGKKSLDEITTLLEKYDLHLGMDVEEIHRQIAEAKNRVTKGKKG